MPRNHRDPIVATPLTHEAILASALRKPGAFAIAQDGSHMLACCPCGCDSLLRLPLHLKGVSSSAPTPSSSSPSWEWDMDSIHPTLVPSIRDVAKCFWHGHLTHGVWNPAADSGVAQTHS